MTSPPSSSEWLVREMVADDIYRGVSECLESLSPVGDVTYGQMMLAWKRSPRKSQRRLVAVEPATGMVLGVCTLVVQQRLARNVGRVGHVEDVAVRGECQGRGVGRSLVEHAVALAAKLGCYKAVLSCSPGNARFYEKCGFRACGEVVMRLDIGGK